MPIEEIGYLTEGMRFIPITEITTDRTMTVFEALDICGVDMDQWAQKRGWDGYDPNRIITRRTYDTEYNKYCGNCGNCEGWGDEGYGVGEYICSVPDEDCECGNDGLCPAWKPITAEDIGRLRERFPETEEEL